MRISVKILFGDERPFEVTSTMSVLELKGLVNEKCNIPVENQKLLLNGRALLDNKVLSEYDIQEGTRINVFVCQPLSALGESLPTMNPSAPSLHTLLYNKLRLFYSDEDSLKVADEFMRDFNARMASLSLDDIERMATQYLEEECAHSATAATDQPDEEDKD